MKRIALILAALTFSASSAMAEDLDSNGSVLQDQVSSNSSYSVPETWVENHGSVLLDQVANNRGTGSEIEVDDSNSSLFDIDADSAF